MWFDLDCLGQPVHRPFKGPLTRKICIMPVMRGDLSQENDNWRISGSGRRIQVVKKWVKEQNFPDDWKKQLGESFLKHVQETTFEYYDCPGKGCSCSI